MKRVHKREETREVLRLFPLANTNFTKSSATNLKLGCIKSHLFQDSKSPQKHSFSFQKDPITLSFTDNLAFFVFHTVTRKKAL